MSWNRAEREAAAAASAIFSAHGWPCEQSVGAKHKLLIVVLPCGRQHRFPLSGTPKRGVQGAVNMAKFEARKLLRKYGAIDA